MSEEWIETKLGNIAIVSPKDPPLPENAPFITMADVDEWGVWAAQSGPKGSRGGIRAQGSDVLVARITPCLENGKIAMVPRDFGAVGGSTEFIVIRADEGVLPEFLFRWATSQATHSAAIGLMTGTTGRQRVSGKDFAELPITLPPLAVQRRIVDLMAHLDNHLANMAVDVNSVLGLTRAMRDELFGSFDGPSVPASQMFDMLLGRQKSERQSVGDYVCPYLRAANIGEEGLRLNDVQTMNFEPHEQQKYGLVPDDVLIVEGGSVGLAARWEGAILGTVGFDKHVIRLRARPELSSSEYGLQWAKWCREAGVFEAQATGITIKALGFGRASALPVPVIPLSEQERLTAPSAGAERCLQLLRSEVKSLQSLRTSMLSLLLSGDIVIPDSYDSLLSGVA